MKSGPATAANIREYFFSFVVQPGQHERPDLVEPVRARRDQRDHAAQLHLQQQTAGGVVDHDLGAGAAAAELLLGLVVGVLDELEQLVVEVDARRRTG